MEPKSFSASAMLTAESCLARYKAESLDKTPSMDNPPAMVGTAVHGALELFVKGVYLDKQFARDDLKLFLDLYKIAYMDTFGTADIDTPEFEDGQDLALKWFKRTEINDTVLSCEVKENFPIPTSIGPIPFNFIWDRADQIDDTTFRIVDYKTIRARVSSEQLTKKIQARAYGLAAQIKWPHAEKIWVQFDLLRHDAVGVVFTREDNANTWRYLKRAAQRIIDTDPNNPPEKLNPECHFCIRKVSCDTLQRSVAGGSIFGISPDDALTRKLQIASQIKALEYLDKELDVLLVTEAEQRQELEWKGTGAKVEITASRRRGVDSSSVAAIVGPELTQRYGGFTMASVDKLLKGEELTEEKKQELKDAVFFKFGQPTAKVTPLDPIEEL